MDKMKEKQPKSKIKINKIKKVAPVVRQAKNGYINPVGTSNR